MSDSKHKATSLPLSTPQTKGSLPAFPSTSAETTVRFFHLCGHIHHYPERISNVEYSGGLCELCIEEAEFWKHMPDEHRVLKVAALRDLAQEIVTAQMEMQFLMSKGEEEEHVEFECGSDRENSVLKEKMIWLEGLWAEFGHLVRD